MRKLILFVSFCAVLGCQNKTTSLQTSSSKNAVSYLALGDSYTIGESVATQDRWPVQLAAVLNQKGIPIEDPRIIAKTGWTTDELMTGIEAANLSKTYDYVSLLIGVNNQYRGRSVENFEEEFVSYWIKQLNLVEIKPKKYLFYPFPIGVSHPLLRPETAKKLVLKSMPTTL